MFTAGADPGFGQGGAQLLRLKVANVAKQSHTSKASNLCLGSRAHLRALEAFGFLMLKYAFSHILETLFLSFLTPKVDKNRALDFTSINLRHSYILHLCFNWMTWGIPSKVRLKNFMTWVVKNRSIVWLVTHCFSLMSQSMSSKWKFTFKNRLKKSALELFSCYQKCKLYLKATKA